MDYSPNCEVYLYDYIQDNIFLGQTNPNKLLIKMFTYGITNGVDIVRHM